jgi:dephospho-CoA kinase
VIVVGVTGSLASGKSQVAKLFHKMGATVIDADAIAKKIIRKGTPIYKALIKVFGKKFLSQNGEIDRRKFAWHVYSHSRELKKLNILTHPGVILEIYKAIEKVKNKNGLLVLDVPLLFESRMGKLADVTVVVRSSEREILLRAIRRGVPKALAKKILAAQWPQSRKARLADFSIENNGSLAELGVKVKKVYGEIITYIDKPSF